MRGIILYQSKYGATEKNAHWLAEVTGCECAETKKADIRHVAEHDVIILGGGIYASGIAGLSFLRKNFGMLQGKKIVLFCVGASPYEESAVAQISQHNLKEDLKDIPLFYCRGAWDEKAMGFMDRNLCRMLQKSVAKMDPSAYEPWMAALMCAQGQTCDWTDKAYLTPVLQELGL